MVLWKGTSTALGDLFKLKRDRDHEQAKKREDQASLSSLTRMKGVHNDSM